MATSTISTRRQIITVVMLVLALIGGLVRWFAPQPSLARDLGSVLMVLWLPIVGNIIAWLIQRAKTPKHVPQGFTAGTVFEPHAQVELTLLPAEIWFARFLATIGWLRKSLSELPWEQSTITDSGNFCSRNMAAASSMAAAS